MIDYHALHQAEIFYASNRYQRIDVPWIVSAEASSVTKPPYVKGMILTDGTELVASAEQGFIQLMLEGKLTPAKKYQATSPCFRDEPVYDEYHLPYFMKLELCHYMPSDPVSALQSIITDAALHMGGTVREIKENGEIDLLDAYTKIELGSYGIRHYKEHYWVYGTGLALPRYSQVC